MNRFTTLASVLLLACSGATFAQQVAPRIAGAAPAVVSTETRQFDFLLGQWTIEVRPKVSSLVAMIHGQPKLAGTWKAVRSADGLGIDDEMRIVDESGNPITLLRTHRGWVTADKRWKIIGNDVARDRHSTAVGQWIGGEMISTGHFTESDGSQILARTRFSAITPGGFRMQQDRSTDNGKTWEEASLIIDARRVPASAAR
jgi:hypothetical protein